MSTVPDFSWLPSTRERFEHMLNVLPPALPADDLAGSTSSVSLPPRKGFARQTVEVEVDPADGEIRIDDATKARMYSRGLGAPGHHRGRSRRSPARRRPALFLPRRPVTLPPGPASRSRSLAAMSSGTAWRTR